jgi:archaellum component FlaG (FlaF/FlaG flagellin family)
MIAVTVAATSPTYAWILIAGWIAGGTVVGVYGQKADDAKKRAEAAAQVIQAHYATINENNHIIYQMKNALSGLKYIVEQGSGDALLNLQKIIQNIYGVLQAIESDIRNFKIVVTDEISIPKKLIIDVAFAAAMNKWEEIAKETDEFQQNVYAYFTKKTANKLCC